MAPVGLRQRLEPRELSVVIGPTAFFVAAVTLLTFDHVRGQLSDAIFWAGLAAIVTAFAWMLERAGRSAGALANQRRDQLTGLGNEEALRAALADRFESGGPAMLFVVEANSFDGEELSEDPDARTAALVDVAHALAGVAGPFGGEAFRIEGARFAIVAPAEVRGPEEIVAAVRATLSRDLSTGVEYGAAELPAEAPRIEAAFALAEQRLRERKRRDLRSARRQAHSALMAALNVRRPDLREHVRSMIPTVISLGRRLGIEEGELDDVVFAAGLQDIGMLGVPEAILEKHGPLTSTERERLQRHPVEGAKIISAAASLSSVARLVRSAYERYDGSGYPDGLAGEQIPLGARIIAPCVALAAMTAQRPHRRPLSQEAALRELRAGAGGQFDPEIVEVLVAELEREAELRATAAVGG